MVGIVIHNADSFRGNESVRVYYASTAVEGTKSTTVPAVSPKIEVSSLINVFHEIIGFHIIHVPGYIPMLTDSRLDLQKSTRPRSVKIGQRFAKIRNKPAKNKRHMPRSNHNSPRSYVTRSAVGQPPMVGEGRGDGEVFTVQVLVDGGQGRP